MADERVAIVTGASGGIGWGVARELAARGYAVQLLGTNAEALSRLAGEISAAAGVAETLAGDLYDLDFVTSIADRTIARFGRIDVLVNNAAWRELVTMREISVESWERTLRVCLTAPAFLARCCAVEMQRRGRGVIVNVTSIMSQQSAGFAPAYVACKGALESLTHELANLYGPQGIRVVAVAPGAIDTELSRDLASSESIAEKSLREYSESMIPLGRWGRSEEIAKAIAWVASDEASYLTGTTVVIDGGWMRHHLPTLLAEDVRPGQFA